VAALATLRLDNGSKWHGACVLPRNATVPQALRDASTRGASTRGLENPSQGQGSGVWRRIDFLLVPADELGAAMLYFTGNDVFNRSMRLLARRKGMRLNQHGLFSRVDDVSGRRPTRTAQLLHGRDEREIFAALGVPWREPVDRNC
jgi:DNA polymerase IV